MPYYRLYHLNRLSGHIDRVDEIDASDDVKAVAIAKERERDTAVELWQERRKVLRLEEPARFLEPAERQVSRRAATG
jgi:hypothetical protein